MTTPDHLDVALGQALEHLTDAAGHVRSLNFEPVKVNLTYIAKAIEALRRGWALPDWSGNVDIGRRARCYGLTCVSSCRGAAAA